MLEQKNTKKQSDVGLGIAIARLTALSYTVCIPLTDNQRYDLVIGDDDGNLFKVEVKTSRQEVRPGVFKVELKTTGSNTNRTKVTKFDPSQVDFVFVLTGDGQEFLIPSGEIKSTDAIQVGGEKWNEWRH